MEIRLPEKVKFIIRLLERNGYEAYAVGGCIRDSLLGRTPQDWDITTSASPEAVKNIFHRTVDTGIEHGTVTVLLEREGFEVTTYRIDGVYEDARHPKNVIFTRSLSEDLKRRDFTINAMAYNETKGLVDLFGGQKDLEQGRICCVGTAKERFTEDALRMLRAVRFGAQLGFSIEENTKEAIKELAGNLVKISAERIQAELVKLLCSDHPEDIRVLYETGISGVIFPWFDVMMKTPQNNPHHCYSVGEHTIEALRHIPPERVLRLTMLFHDIAKPACRTTDEDGVDHFKGHPEMGAERTAEIMRQLKFDNDTISRVKALVRWHDDNPAATPRSVRRAIHRVGLRQYPDLFAVKRADTMGKYREEQAETLNYIDAYEAQYEKILAEGQCVALADLDISGRDLINAGWESGRQIGTTLDALLTMVLEHPEYNHKEILMHLAKEYAILSGSEKADDRQEGTGGSHEKA